LTVNVTKKLGEGGCSNHSKMVEMFAGDRKQNVQGDASESKRLIVAEVGENGNMGLSGLQCRFRSTGEKVAAFIDEEDSKIKCRVEVGPFNTIIIDHVRELASYQLHAWWRKIVCTCNSIVIAVLTNANFFSWTQD